MKKTLFKFAAAAFLGASVLAFSGVSRAADTNSAAGKISGTVTAVDTNAMTFTVGGQTYEESSASVLSKNGKPATLSEVVVGDAVKGSITTGSDGKLAAAKVHFGNGKGEATSTETKAKTTAKKAKKKKKASEAIATNSVPDSVIPALPAEAPFPVPPPMDVLPGTNAPAAHP